MCSLASCELQLCRILSNVTANFNCFINFSWVTALIQLFLRFNFRLIAIRLQQLMQVMQGRWRWMSMHARIFILLRDSTLWAGSSGPVQLILMISDCEPRSGDSTSASC